jgi:hypothetical protein
MARHTDEILADIDAFRPAGGVWLSLDDLLAELWDAGVPVRALPVLFGVLERFPDDDGAGVLWSKQISQMRDIPSKTRRDCERISAFRIHRDTRSGRSN